MDSCRQALPLGVAVSCSSHERGEEDGEILVWCILTLGQAVQQEDSFTLELLEEHCCVYHACIGCLQVVVLRKPHGSEGSGLMSSVNPCQISNCMKCRGRLCVDHMCAPIGL